MCQIVQMRDIYMAAKEKANNETRARIRRDTTMNDKRTQYKDYEVGCSASPAPEIRETIDGFSVSIKPVCVNGHIVYDSSIAQDGRVVFWNTSAVKKTAHQIMREYQYCEQTQMPEFGIHGTYFNKPIYVGVNVR